MRVTMGLVTVGCEPVSRWLKAGMACFTRNILFFRSWLMIRPSFPPLLSLPQSSSCSATPGRQGRHGRSTAGSVLFMVARGRAFVRGALPFAGFDVRKRWEAQGSVVFFERASEYIKRPTGSQHRFSTYGMPVRNPRS